VLESVPFLTGYGVESGLLIDIRRSFGLWSLAQVDLELRIHHNQPLASLSKMSFGILQALFKKLDEDGLISLKTEPGTVYNTLKREGDGYAIVPAAIEVIERPPMKSIPGYSDRAR
jgi:glucosyl-3-phosphoglycerate synthase